MRQLNKICLVMSQIWKCINSLLVTSHMEDKVWSKVLVGKMDSFVVKFYCHLLLDWTVPGIRFPFLTFWSTAEG